MVCGMTGAVVRRPGECQQVVIEIAAGCCIFVVVTVMMLGESAGVRQKNRPKSTNAIRRFMFDVLAVPTSRKKREKWGTRFFLMAES